MSAKNDTKDCQDIKANIKISKNIEDMLDNLNQKNEANMKANTDKIMEGFSMLANVISNMNKASTKPTVNENNTNDITTNMDSAEDEDEESRANKFKNEKNMQGRFYKNYY